MRQGNGLGWERGGRGTRDSLICGFLRDRQGGHISGSLPLRERWELLAIPQPCPSAEGLLLLFF